MSSTMFDPPADPTPIADRIKAIAEQRGLYKERVQTFAGLDDRQRATHANHPYGLPIAQVSAQNAAREARAEARADHERILKRLNLPHNVRSMAEWVAEVERSGGHNQFPHTIRWTKFFFGPQYMGDESNGYTTDYTNALGRVREHESTIQVLSRPEYQTSDANKAMLAELVNKPPKEVTDARELIRKHDDLADKMIADARGEIAQATPLPDDARTTYANALSGIRDRVVDAHDLFMFAEPKAGKLRDLASEPAKAAEQAAGMLAKIGRSILADAPKAPPGTTTVRHLVDQLRTAFSAARDADSMKVLIESAGRQALADKIAGKHTDSEVTKPLTDLGKPAADVAAPLDTTGRIATVPERGVGDS